MIILIVIREFCNHLGVRSNAVHMPHRFISVPPNGQTVVCSSLIRPLYWPCCCRRMWFRTFFSCLWLFPSLVWLQLIYILFFAGSRKWNRAGKTLGRGATQQGFKSSQVWLLIGSVRIALSSAPIFWNRLYIEISLFHYDFLFFANWFFLEWMSAQQFDGTDPIRPGACWIAKVLTDGFGSHYNVLYSTQDRPTYNCLTLNSNIQCSDFTIDYLSFGPTVCCDHSLHNPVPTITSCKFRSIKTTVFIVSNP